MMNCGVIYSACDSADKIEINKIELANRLKTEVGFTNDEIELCKQQLMKEISYKYAYIKVPIKLIDDCYVNLNFATVKSKDLCKNLVGCKYAIVLGVTAGIGVDRLLARLNMTSQARHFITDAQSSAAIESYCDYVNYKLEKEYKLKPRFSPGYGDFPLEMQPEILKVLSADKTLGITLNESLLMTPVKSITAIIGVL